MRRPRRSPWSRPAGRRGTGPAAHRCLRSRPRSHRARSNHSRPHPRRRRPLPRRWRKRRHRRRGAGRGLAGRRRNRGHGGPAGDRRVLRRGRGRGGGPSPAVERALPGAGGEHAHGGVRPRAGQLAPGAGRCRHRPGVARIRSLRHPGAGRAGRCLVPRGTGFTSNARTTSLELGGALGGRLGWRPAGSPLAPWLGARALGWGRRQRLRVEGISSDNALPPLDVMFEVGLSWDPAHTPAPALH